MCGPLTCLFLKGGNSTLSTFQYHSSRLLSYSVVVLALSILGEQTLKNMTWNRFSTFVLWALIVAVIFQLFYKFMGQRVQSLVTKISSAKWLPIGLGSITGLLPCGLLIPAYIGASSMHGKEMVFLSIFFFFAGTLPAMLMGKSLLTLIRKLLPLSLHKWLNPSLTVIFLLFQIWMIKKF